MFRIISILMISLVIFSLVGCTGFSPTAARVYDLPRYYSLSDIPNARKLTADEIRAEFIGVELLGWSPVVAQSKTRQKRGQIYLICLRYNCSC